MSEQITHYTPCCATCRHAEAGGPCAWRHDNADGDCCPDWEYGNHAAWIGDDTPYPMASREITAEPHGSMEEHTALCEHTRVESLPDRRKQLPHHVMVLHSQKGLLAAAALAYRYGKELHPAGTAAKLQELAKERDEAEVVRSDRRRLLAENAELRQDAAENAADVWSEPVIDMTWQQCADLCAAMGRMLETIQHEAYKYEWRLHDGREDHRAHGSAVNGEVAAHLAVRYCAQCEDRYNSATDRVRLTGLEPQQ